MTQLTISTSSAIPSVASQCGQRDLPNTTLSSFGRRLISDPRKLPTNGDITKTSALSGNALKDIGPIGN